MSRPIPGTLLSDSIDRSPCRGLVLPSRHRAGETDCVTETLGYLECLWKEDRERGLMLAKALHTTPTAPIHGPHPFQ
jgi:hypothetical protein